jgi:hypothetical protein
MHFVAEKFCKDFGPQRETLHLNRMKALPVLWYGVIPFLAEIKTTHDVA